MGRISRTIELAKVSWRVLQADRELLALPAMSGIASLIVSATFIAPFALTQMDASGDVGPLGYVLLFLLYVVLAMVTIFFNAALVSAANERLEGGDPTIGSAVRGATAHLGSIAVWALISATVSVVLRALEERGLLGNIVSSIAGLAWSLTTFLVIPILVIEGTSPGPALKRSATLFKQTWGEQVAGSFGFGVLGFVAAIPAIALVVLAFAIGSAAMIVVAICAAVLWMILIAVVLSALSAIFQTALYRHAAGRTGPVQFFDATTIQGAFR